MKKLKLIDPSLLDGKRILRAEDLHAVSTANEIIEDTELWSKHTRDRLSAETEAERMNAFSEAYSEGILEFILAAEAYQVSAKRLGGKLEFLVRKCVYRILEKWPPEELLKASIGLILSEIERDAEICISVHPERAQILRQVVSGLIAENANPILITEDKELAISDCIIFTPSDVIDVSITVLVDQLIDGLEDFISLAETTHQEEICD